MKYGIVIFLGLLVSLVAVAADENLVQAPKHNAAVSNPKLLLNKMVHAARSKSYQGLLLIHPANQKTLSIQLQHRAARDMAPEQEKLIALDGKQQEVIVDGDGIMLYLPKEQDVQVLRNPFMDTFLKEAGYFSQYQISMGSEERVLGKYRYVLHITPKDTWRYHYKIWIDKTNFMYVRAAWFDQKSLVTEASFLNVMYLPEPDVLVPFVSARTLSLADKPRNNPISEGCRVKWLPKGFKLLSRNAYPPEGPGKTEHLVFGDGLSRVSVYVDVSAEVEIEDMSLGRTHMYSMPLGEHKKVIVLGEVPLQTVRKMAESVELQTVEQKSE